jgi:hypothetical protein
LIGIDKTRLTITTEAGLQRFMRGFGVTINVCDDCNHGWMHDLEDEAIPILAGPILGHPAEFSESDQRVMARWAVKTALLLELSLRVVRGVGHAPAGAFDFLRQHGEPPPGHRVWIGAVKAKRTWPGWTSSSTVMVGPSEADMVPQGYLAAFLVGHLLFQVFGPNLGTDHNIELGVIPDRVLRPIWPISLPVIRWPFAILQPEQLDRMWPPVTEFRII